MPVDPSDVHASRRQRNQLFEKYKAHNRLRRRSERRGALTLATVPCERTVGDAFRLMLETCERNGYMSIEEAVLPKHLRPLQQCVHSLTSASAHTGEDVSSSIGSCSSSTNADDSHATANAEKRDDELRRSFVSPFYAVGLGSAREVGRGGRRGDDQSGIAVGSAEEAVTHHDSNSGLTSHGADSRVDSVPHLSSAHAESPAVRLVDATWEMLDRTALDAPVHGALALRGKSLVETTILRLAYRLFPRLRSRHVQQLLHQTCGLLPCGEIAVRLGFAELAQVSAEVSMWRELNVLHERARVARVQAAAHRQRVEQKVGQQRRWYWRAVLRSVTGRLQLFPVHREDLEPRLEWIRQSVFAFVAFVHLAEESGDGGVRVRELIERLFCPALTSFAWRSDLLTRAHDLLALTGDMTQTTRCVPHEQAERPLCKDETGGTRYSGAATAPSLFRSCEEKTKKEARTEDRQAHLSFLRRELARVESRAVEEEEIIDGVRHPLTHRSALRAAQLHSSGGTHAVQGLYDDIFTDYHVVRHRRLAPALIVDCLRVVNAFKEAQLILRYAPHVRPVLRRSPIDVDQVVRKVVEVHETNSYASMYTAQQYRAVEYTVCRLYSGKHYCLGEGKGETLMEAMQEAAHHMVFNYYVRADDKSSPSPSSTANATRAEDEERCLSQASVESRDTFDTKLPRVNLGQPRTEEEIFL